jgi:hypothetical protein
MRADYVEPLCDNETRERERENYSTQVQSDIRLPHILEGILQRNEQKVLEADAGRRNHPVAR